MGELCFKDAKTSYFGDFFYFHHYCHGHHHGTGTHHVS